MFYTPSFHLLRENYTAAKNRHLKENYIFPRQALTQTPQMNWLTT